MTREGRFNRGELKAVGRQLRLLRIARGWSLKKLSDMSDVSIAAIRKVEMGESNPSLLTVLALVEALDEPVDRLISAVLRSGSKVQVVRAAEHEANGRDLALSDGLQGRQMAGRLVALAPDQALELPPAERRAGNARAQAGPKGEPLFGYVLDGSVILAEGDGGERTCSRGDAFHIYDPARDTVRGAGAGAELVVVENCGEIVDAGGASALAAGNG